MVVEQFGLNAPPMQLVISDAVKVGIAGGSDAQFPSASKTNPSTNPASGISHGEISASPPVISDASTTTLDPIPGFRVDVPPPQRAVIR